MAIDSFRMASFYKKLYMLSLNKSEITLGKRHEVTPYDQLDPSLTNRLVYGNRSDWYVSACTNGFCDVDLPVENGVRRYPTYSEISYADAIGLARKKRNGMRLY